MAQPTDRPPIRVEVWSDIACPWCWLGRAHLEQAISQLGIDAEVEMRSFQLAPDLDTARPVKEYLAKRYGEHHDLNASQRHLSEMGTRAGLTYAFERAIMANTFDAHRLHHLAKEHGKGDAVMVALMRAQHTDGADMSSRDTLLGVGIEAGLDASAITTLLDGDEYADAVRADIADGRALGVQGVPFFVFDRRLAVSGAQPVEVFVRALGMTRDGSA